MVSDFKNAFPGIFNFTVGILLRRASVKQILIGSFRNFLRKLLTNSSFLQFHHSDNPTLPIYAPKIHLFVVNILLMVPETLSEYRFPFRGGWKILRLWDSSLFPNDTLKNHLIWNWKFSVHEIRIYSRTVTVLFYLPMHLGFSMHLFMQSWLPVSISLKRYMNLL